MPQLSKHTVNCRNQDLLFTKCASVNHNKWIRNPEKNRCVYIRRALQLQAGHYDSMGAVEYPRVGFIQTEAAGADH